MSVPEEQSPNQNKIGIQLQNIMLKIEEEMNNDHRLGGRRTEELENSLLEIRNVIAHQTRGILEIFPTFKPWAR